MAVTYLPPADGSLAACFAFNNTAGLSTDSCPCQSNLACESGICTVSGKRCNGATNKPVCAPTGLNLGISATGCPCQSNLDCATGLCPANPLPGELVKLCLPSSGSVSDPVPGVCLVGNASRISADGCPCTSSNECKGSCNGTTDTCGGLVGKVVARQPTLTATVSANTVALGASTTASAILGNSTRADSGQVQFRLHAPGADACATLVPIPVFTRLINATGNGSYASTAFTPTVAGVHQWVARYSGNAFNLSVATPCNSAAQQVNVVDQLFRDGFE